MSGAKPPAGGGFEVCGPGAGPGSRLRGLAEAVRLALADYRHERLMSACAVLGLAAVLAPLLVLFGVRYGLISHLTENLLDDPRNLEVAPVGSGRYSRDWLADLGRHPRAAFVIPQTRTIAATIELVRPENEEGAGTALALIPTAGGDPLIARWRPEARPESLRAGAGLVEIILSEPAAAKLGLKAGDRARGRVGRIREGRRESGRAELRVAAVLPPAAQQKDAAYVPLDFLLAVEDYRDGRARPDFGWPGQARPEAERRFASFRLYADSLEGVTELRDLLRAEGLEAYTQAESIESLKGLNRALGLVFGLVAGTAAAGFVAATVSSSLAEVRRKSRFLGLMRLMGYSRPAIMLFPLSQAGLTSVLGLGLSLLFYLAAARGLDQLFAASLPGGAALTLLTGRHVLLFLGATFLLSGLAALAAARRAADIEPSEVIREL